MAADPLHARFLAAQSVAREAGRLARRFLADPTALAIEAKGRQDVVSAADRAVEALIAERLAAYRAGRTTVVTTGSPLLLHHADRVAFLSGERVAAYGTHEELLRTSRGYRGVVARALDDETGASTASSRTRNGEEG